MTVDAIISATEIKNLLGPERVANLEKLAAYLERGELRARFDMIRFCAVNHKYSTECGAVGCMVGHGPYAGIAKSEDEEWNGYSKRVFAPKSDNADSLWKWLFCMGWAGTDNTPEGGAARIRWTITHGLPADWSGQIVGDAPLCYRSESCQTF